MLYKDIRSQIKSGDLFAWRKTSFFSKIIRAWTESSYNHVGIAWLYKNRVFVLQDRLKDGIDIVCLSRQLPCDWIQTNCIWTDDVEDFAINNLGQPYGSINILTAALEINPIGLNMVCSEYASKILQLGQIISNKVNYTPNDLVNILLDKGCILQNIKEK